MAETRYLARPDKLNDLGIVFLGFKKVHDIADLAKKKAYSVIRKRRKSELVVSAVQPTRVQESYMGLEEATRHLRGSKVKIVVSQ